MSEKSNEELYAHILALETIVADVAGVLIKTHPQLRGELEATGLYSADHQAQTPAFGRAKALRGQIASAILQSADPG